MILVSSILQELQQLFRVSEQPEKPSVAMMDQVLDNEPALEIGRYGSHGMSPLHYAAWKNNMALVEVLVRRDPKAAKRKDYRCDY